jgi:hypothetical protein
VLWLFFRRNVGGLLTGEAAVVVHVASRPEAVRMADPAHGSALTHRRCSGLYCREPAMPHFLPIFGALFFILAASGAAAPTPDEVDPVCVVATANPVADHEPPAWLLLAGAVILLGAGRLAAS